MLHAQHQQERTTKGLDIFFANQGSEVARRGGANRLAIDDNICRTARTHAADPDPAYTYIH